MIPGMVRPRRRQSAGSKALPWIALLLTIVWVLGLVFDLRIVSPYLPGILGMGLWLMVLGTHKP